MSFYRFKNAFFDSHFHYLIFRHSKRTLLVFHWSRNCRRYFHGQYRSNYLERKGLETRLIIESKLLWELRRRQSLYIFANQWKETHITILVDGQPEKQKVRFWNATVANLTLMAMGSSMPEIFLNIIEIVFNKFETGALGPGTVFEQKNMTKTLISN